ncbi:EAL domain-containing protein [Sulfurospirillum sp. UCH001]|jgi:PAS domain S-box-containing protein|uniref:EAL domain-containing response regulator n=1 Tax=Sulfurospirillum sp. UCH001 TaxID=1581011 RepID=UPI001E64CF99|nr:EAL domain-containing protein [Sulfurospirillum sp. UCH001]
MERTQIASLKQMSKGMTLLYIEDDPQARDAANSLFSDFFDDVIVGFDGEDGARLFASNYHKIDLVITDITMPRMNGIEMIHAIRQINPDIAIIVLSAHNETSFLTQTIEAGVDGYLIKPLNVTQLIRSIGKVVEKLHLRYENKKNSLLLKQYENITNTSSIISKTDPKGVITFVNEKFCQISGFTKEELIGKPHNVIRHPDMPKTAFRDLWRTIKDEKRTWQGIVKNRAKNGDTYYVKTTVQPILNPEGEVQEYISLRHDITAIMSDKKQLFDFLEANRLSVLILVQIEDYNILEKFYDKASVEKIEDAFGKNMLYLMPNRWGFQRVYHLENGLYAFAIDRRNCKASKEEIHAVLEQFLMNVKEYVVKIDSIEYDISAICSFTYGIFKIFEDAKIGIENAIQTKQPIVYADGLSGIEYDNALKNIETIHIIKTAIDNRKIISYFQPIVNNQTQKIEKYESLVRLVTEDGQLLTPLYFLDTAKKGRYYSKITKIVLENSFAALYKISEAAISINLSVHDIERDEITHYIENLLVQHEDEAHRIIFELLESEDIKDFALIKQFIQKVKAKGVKIAIDDFGTGYSNFERLLSYEPDILKIDGSLIKNIHNNQINQHIVETVMLFAKKQNLSTVAEFVENETIYEIVRDMGIDYSQGFYFGKPEMF